MIPSSYRFINTMGDEKIKSLNVSQNRQNIEEIKSMTDDLVKDVKEIRNDIKEILELVKKKEERDLNKWF
jgi:DNA-binding ferritin-like protein